MHRGTELHRCGSRANPFAIPMKVAVCRRQKATSRTVSLRAGLNAGISPTGGEPFTVSGKDVREKRSGRSIAKSTISGSK